ncbi:MAG: tetratricopeptide repeat protein [bacterium]
MAENNDVRPYLKRIKNWKIRNMVMMYLEAREKFNIYRRLLRKGVFISFEKMREISDILFEIKEDHHLLFKRLIDPKKNKYEKAFKFTPDEIETEFMNNIGLLFHKVMATRELKYVMEHYVEESNTFHRTKDNLQYHLDLIDELFNDGIKILKDLICRYKDNILLLTLLLEDPKRTRKHFGEEIMGMLNRFVEGKGLDELYNSVGKFYLDNGWHEKAIKMFHEVVKNNPNHAFARKQLTELN